MKFPSLGFTPQRNSIAADPVDGQRKRRDARPLRGLSNLLLQADHAQPRSALVSPAPSLACSPEFARRLTLSRSRLGGSSRVAPRLRHHRPPVGGPVCSLYLYPPQAGRGS